ncbi:uncharacterized protein BX663DRAFT_511920 [Cokeromyces recurvatus]|uniref:uncharacterized protein n=1 Tax=Cokeromyces recurvatus TaxID=90255 RepID=UPI00221F5538|nr:uncharacterized protein BX663DRAFT_511920 [Cokeromyces recurvatus]KAI7902160.1 hypothetical protein BX663DRAFT_511920 [Cokeromyces recurvatus]
MSSNLLWRMNLCAASDEIPCTFFIAMNYKVHVYTLDTMSSPFKEPTKVLASPNALNTNGGSESPFIINAIKVGRMLEKEILVTVSEIGEVCIWKTEHLDEPPMILNNGIATWGIAIHGDQGLLAVSANNWKITIFNLLEMTKNNPIFGKKTRQVPSYLDSIERVELEGHEHNIPNIDFNESGRYIASASIDMTCRVWDITTQKVVTLKKSPPRDLEQNAWCWSAKFIKPGNFKYAVCHDKRINKEFLKRYNRGCSTSLSNLGLCHSANIPAFPMNISRIFDDENIDFEIYEGEGENEEEEEGELDDSLWDNALLEQEEEWMQEIFDRQQQENEYILSRPSSLEQTSNNESNRTASNRRIVRTQEEWEATLVDTEEGWGSSDVTEDEDASSNSRHMMEMELLRNILQERMSTRSNSSSSIPSSHDIISEETTIPSNCIPNIIKSTTKSSLINKPLKQSEETETRRRNHTDLGEYLIMTTSKDIILTSTSVPRMNEIRAEHNMINKVDIRTDQLLRVLDRINMIEWLPELELLVVASQKGTVALTRIIQVEFENGHQACYFNNEFYLPTSILQSTPLYGMTVKKVKNERFSPISYQIFLFYFNGNVLGYTITRKDSSSISIDNLFL